MCAGHCRSAPGWVEGGGGGMGRKGFSLPKGTNQVQGQCSYPLPNAMHVCCHACLEAAVIVDSPTEPTVAHTDRGHKSARVCVVWGILVQVTVRLPFLDIEQSLPPSSCCRRGQVGVGMLAHFVAPWVVAVRVVWGLWRPTVL